MNKRRRDILAALAPAVDQARQRPEVASAVRVNALSADVTEVMIYGAIGQGGWFDDSAVSAAGMSKILADITTPSIYLRVNSGGGDVFDGVAIHTMLARHPATVTAFVDGIAASAASFILMAADKIVCARNAMIMIHDGMTMAYGNADTMTRTAELLDKVSANIADMYAVRCGGSAEDWRALMTQNGEDGMWYTGVEAVDAGLADQTTEEDAPLPEDVVAKTRHILARFHGHPEYHARESALPDPDEAPDAPATPPVADPVVDPRDDIADVMLALLAERMKITEGRRA